MKGLISTGFALLIGVVLVAPAHAMTEAQCEAEWKKVDADNTGTLSEAEGARYYAALRVADKTVEAGKLSRTDFLNHCKVGLFDVRQIDPGAPLKGANSFTEGQARDRAVSHGLSSVSALKKDDDGIWRGTAKRDGKDVSVAVDYKGNIVAN